jgi:hypothetical protein
METSNLIALVALIVAILGIIPQFQELFSRRRRIKPDRKPNSKIVKNKAEIAKMGEAGKEREPMSPMMRILILIIFAVAIFLMEIIIFGIITYFFDIEVNLATLPLIWKIIFFALFLIPGTFLILAMLVFVGNTED